MESSWKFSRKTLLHRDALSWMGDQLRCCGSVGFDAEAVVNRRSDFYLSHTARASSKCSCRADRINADFEMSRKSIAVMIGGDQNLVGQP